MNLVIDDETMTYIVFVFIYYTVHMQEKKKILTNLDRRIQIIPHHEIFARI